MEWFGALPYQSAVLEREVLGGVGCWEVLPGLLSECTIFTDALSDNEGEPATDTGVGSDESYGAL
jgi:hypothetical protein